MLPRTYQLRSFTLVESIITLRHTLSIMDRSISKSQESLRKAKETNLMLKFRRILLETEDN